MSAPTQIRIPSVECTNLHLDIQHTDTALLCHVFYGFNTSPIIVSSELRMLDKALFFHELQKFLFRSEVVLTTINLTWAWRPCGIYLAKRKDESMMIAGGARKGNKRETENPKVEGWAVKRRFSIVDFPEPDGPVITIGRWVSVTDP